MQDLVASFGIAFFERRIITVVLTYALVSIAMYLVNACYVEGVAWRRAVVNLPDSMSPFGIIFAIIGMALRRLALYRALRMVSEDKKKYDLIWFDLLRKDQSSRWLTHIQSEVCIQEAILSSMPI